MATKSGTDRRHVMEVSLVEGEFGMFRAGNRETSDTNGIYQRPLVSLKANQFSEHKLIPWYRGENNEPQYLMRLISDNPTLLGLLLTKCTILHGQGLTLMRWEGNQKVPIPMPEWPEEIRDFYLYNDLDWLSYQSFVDEEMVGNYFWQMRFSRGSSTSKKKVVRIDRLAPETVRAKEPEDARSEILKYIAAPTWENYKGEENLELQAFRRRKFFNSKMKIVPGSGKWTQVCYHGKRQFPLYPAYTPPHWYGARYHIELQNEIPRWHINNIINQFGARVRVSISRRYMQQMLAKTNPDTQKNYTEDEAKKAISELVRDHMSNPEKVGSILLTPHDWDHQGRVMQDILIETIKLDIKDDAYNSLEETINNKITSSVGVQAALASLITNKGMSSGSELTQAWNIESAKALRTQKLVLDPIEFIHRYNGWDPALTWGFPNPSLVTKDIAAEGMIPAANTTQPEDE